LLRQFERLGDLTAINRAVGILKEAKDLCSMFHDHSRREWIVNEANSLLRRYNHLGDCADISEAQMLLQEALLRLPAHHPARSSTLKLFGNALLRRFEHLNDLNDIREALQILREAVSLSPDIDPNNNLGYCLVCRFQRLGNLKDIQDALVIFGASADSLENSCEHASTPS
jgi:tetratricopeptide (TPR) repeat protein